MSQYVDKRIKEIADEKKNIQSLLFAYTTHDGHLHISVPNAMTAEELRKFRKMIDVSILDRVAKALGNG